MEKLLNIDRRIIFIFVFLGVSIPLLVKFQFPIKPTKNVRAAHEMLEAAAAGEKGGRVLFSFDYGPGSEPELQPMALSLLRHCFSSGIKVVAICLWPDAPGLAEAALTTVAEEYGKKVGIDYAFFGYKPGLSSVVINMGQDFNSAFPRDRWGTPTKELPLTKNIGDLNDFDAVMVLAAGNSPEMWIAYGQEKFKFPLAAGCTAVMAPDLFPFLQSGQMTGLIGGLAGAAEYETLVESPGTATVGMRPQSVTHLVVILFILLGNLMYFLTRRSSARPPTEPGATP